MISLKVYYGPYEAYGAIKHRIQRLRGLLQYLEDNDYKVEIIQVNHLNKLAIELFDREIFLADIRNLKFNIYWEDDVLCKRIIRTIREAESRMSQGVVDFGRYSSVQAISKFGSITFRNYKSVSEMMIHFRESVEEEISNDTETF